MKKKSCRWSSYFVAIRKLKFVFSLLLLLSGKSVKAQFDSSLLGPPDLQIEEQTTVKFSTITQFYWRFRTLPAPGTNVQVWKSGVLQSTYPLSSVNIVIEVPTGFDYTLKVNGNDVAVINGRINKPKQQVEVSAALMSTLAYDQQYLAGTQSILSAMDENVQISYFEKLALIQVHYLNGLPLDDSYRLTPEGIATHGYYKSVSGSFPSTDPYDGYGRILVGNLGATGTTGPAPMEGQTAGAGYKDGDMWGISGAPGSDPYVLIVINGVWRVFNYKTYCKTSLIVTKAPFVKNVRDADGGYVDHVSPYEHQGFLINPGSIENSPGGFEDTYRHYEELKNHVVMGASVSRFMKQRGYPRLPFTGGPDNKLFAHIDIGTPSMQYITYNLLGTGYWNVSVCPCEIPITIAPKYEGAYEMKAEISDGAGAKSSHVQVMDYAITEVVDQSTGKVLHTSAGVAEGALKCQRDLNPEWVTAFSDVAANFATVALQAALIAAGGVPISPAVISQLTDSSLGAYAGSLATLFYTNKFIFSATDCGYQSGNYVIIPPTTYFNTNLKPNRAIQIITASGQKMELRGDHRWESLATLRSRAATGIFFPQMDATSSNPCCSKAHGAWLHTALTANDSIENVEFLQTFLRPRTIWDSKYTSGSPSRLFCYGHHAMAFGAYYPACALSGPVTYLKKSNENDLTGQTDLVKQGYLAQNFPNPFSSNSEIRYQLPEGAKTAMIGIYDITGKKVKVYPISTLNSEGSVMIDKTELQPGMYFYKLDINGNTFDAKQMVFTN